MAPAGRYPRVSDGHHRRRAVPGGSKGDRMTESPDAFAVFLDAVQSGRWMLAAAALLVGLVWITRTFGGHALPWLASDRGGAALALGGGGAGAVLPPLPAGGGPLPA